MSISSELDKLGLIPKSNSSNSVSTILISASKPW
jgi:hypothetical protein